MDVDAQHIEDPCLFGFRSRNVRKPGLRLFCEDPAVLSAVPLAPGPLLCQSYLDLASLGCIIHIHSVLYVPYLPFELVYSDTRVGALLAYGPAENDFGEDAVPGDLLR